MASVTGNRLAMASTTKPQCGHCACVECHGQSWCNCTEQIWEDCRCPRHANHPMTPDLAVQMVQRMTGNRLAVAGILEDL